MQGKLNAGTLACAMACVSALHTALPASACANYVHVRVPWHDYAVRGSPFCFYRGGSFSGIYGLLVLPYVQTTVVRGNVLFHRTQSLERDQREVRTAGVTTIDMGTQYRAFQVSQSARRSSSGLPFTYLLRHRYRGVCFLLVGFTTPSLYCTTRSANIPTRRQMSGRTGDTSVREAQGT